MMSDAHWFGGGFMWIIWILVLFVIIWGIKSNFSTNNNSLDTQKSALNILKERYVRGDINRDEFEQKKKDLGG